MAISPLCGSITSMWQYHHRVAVSPPCGNITSMWQYHYRVTVLPPCGSITTVWQYHLHSAISPPFGSITSMWQYHLPVAILPPCGSITTVWQHHHRVAIYPAARDITGLSQPCVASVHSTLCSRRLQDASKFAISCIVFLTLMSTSADVLSKLPYKKTSESSNSAASLILKAPRTDHLTPNLPKPLAFNRC